MEIVRREGVIDRIVHWSELGDIELFDNQATESVIGIVRECFTEAFQAYEWVREVYWAGDYLEYIVEVGDHHGNLFIFRVDASNGCLLDIDPDEGYYTEPYIGGEIICSDNTNQTTTHTDNTQNNTGNIMTQNKT